MQRSRNIDSFSHLTFQEYFTAREIIGAADREQALSKLRYARACARVMVLSGQVKPELEQALDELNEQLLGEEYNGSLPVRSICKGR